MRVALSRARACVMCVHPPREVILIATLCSMWAPGKAQQPSLSACGHGRFCVRVCRLPGLVSCVFGYRLVGMFGCLLLFRLVLLRPKAFWSIWLRSVCFVFVIVIVFVFVLVLS